MAAVVGCTAIAGVQLANYYSNEGTHAAELMPYSSENNMVIVRLSGIDFEQGASSADITAAVAELNREIEAAPGRHELVRIYENFPLAVYAVDDAGIAALEESSLVESVSVNRRYEQERFVPTESPIEAIDGSYEAGFADGYSGSGKKIIVIDDGVDKNHMALSGRVVSEACFGYNMIYSNATISSHCANQAEFSNAPNSGLPCAEDCTHGTMVAAAAVSAPLIVSFDGSDITLETRGVAADADVIAIQSSVLLTYTDGSVCESGEASCKVLDDAVLLSALDYSYSLASNDSSVAAVNFSIGSTTVFAETIAECRADSSYDNYNSVFGLLKAIGVAPVVAAGNSGDVAGNEDKIASPACTENAIAVSATTTDGSAIASYSNNGHLTTLLAPGGDVANVEQAGGFTEENMSDMLWLPVAGTVSGVTAAQGTSFSAPMVSGAFAVLREKNDEMTVDELAGVLQNTGASVVDARSGYTVGGKKLIQVNTALNSIALAGNNNGTDIDLTNNNEIGVPRTGIYGKAQSAGFGASQASANESVNPITLIVTIILSSASFVILAKNAMPKRVRFARKG